MDEENVTNEILEKGIAYRDPVTGNIIDKSEYLSGNVKDKLVEARAALEDHPEFQKTWMTWKPYSQNVYPMVR